MATTIREWIDEWDHYLDQNNPKSNTKSSLTQFEHIYLGASQESQTLSQIESTHQPDPAFVHFRKRLSDFLSVYIQSINAPLPGNRWLKLQPDYMVCLFFRSFFKSLHLKIGY